MSGRRGLVLKACALRFFDTFLLIVPFYTVMFADRGLSPTEIGVALACWSATGLVLEIPSGVLADRMSRRTLLAVALLVRVVGFGCWLLVPSFWGFLAGLMLWGVKSALMSGTFEALVYDELKAEGREADYARAMGRIQAARMGGVLAASLVSASVVGAGYNALIIASAISGVAAVLVALTLPNAPRTPESRQASYAGHLREGLQHAIQLPGVLPLMIFIAAIQAVALAYTDYWQLFGRDVGLPASGIALFVAAVFGVDALTSVFAHRAGSLPRPVLYGLVVGAGLSLIAAAWTFQAGSVALALLTVSLFRIADVNADARFQHAIREETRATVASVKGFGTHALTTVLVLLFGVIAEGRGYRGGFLVFGLAMTAIGLAYTGAAMAFRPRRLA